MDYPATQRFFNDDEDQEEEDETDGDAETPLRADKKIKVGVLLVDSVAYPVHKGENKVGRIDSCSIVIDHNTISKEHAEIEAGAGSKTTFISDLGSLNKTKLNDIILRPGRLYQLQDGDVVRFGSVRAVFKAEKKDSAASRNSDDFVVPETPGPIEKKVQKIIPGTPDLSFDENRSSDVSLVAGTQEGGRTSPRLSREPASLRATAGRLANLEPRKDDSDISEVETQNNFSIPDSDEENIFDMMTQQSDIHDDETQKFSVDNVSAVMLSKYIVNKVEPHSSSIEDMETQKFSKDCNETESINDPETQKLPVREVANEPRPSMDKIEPGVSCSINDLETQKFGAGDPAPDPRTPIESHSGSINDLETQKFAIDRLASEKTRPVSINDVETQKPDVLREENDDSETDEEGIFENSDTGSVDLFNAPTQVIRTSKSPRGGDDEDSESTGDVITQRRVPEVDEAVPSTSAIAEERNKPEIEPETRAEPTVSEEVRAPLNDSIESKLNHMFDDVNETTVEEPTQMLTQHLEKILDCTQAGEAESANRDEDRIEGADDAASSNDGERNESLNSTPKKSRAPVIRVPEIISTQELFADLPAVNIFRTPRRGRIKVSPMSDCVESPRSNRSGKSESRSPRIAGEAKTRDRNNTRGQFKGAKRAGSTESVESISSKRPKVEEPKTALGKIQTPSKTDGRKKPRIQKEVDSSPSPKEVEIRKGLPLKKRGSSVIPSPPTPQKHAVEVVVSTPRAGTRSSVKMPLETGTRSSRSSGIDRPKVPEPKRPNPKVKPSQPSLVLPAKTEAVSQNKRGTKAESAAPLPRRPRKKPLDSSDVVSDEEVSPVKKPRTTTSSVLPPNVNDRQRAKRTNASQNQSLPVPGGRRGRLAASTSALENFSESGHQSSLESQEIQAILGVADGGDTKAPERGGSRFRREMRVFENGNEAEDRALGFKGFSKTDVSTKVEDGFERPVGRPVRQTRNSHRVETEAKGRIADVKETKEEKKDAKGPSKAPANTRRAKTVNGDETVTENTPRKGLRQYFHKLAPAIPKPDDKVKAEDDPIVAQEAAPVRGKREAPRKVGKENGIDELNAPKKGRKKDPGQPKRGRGNRTVLSDDDVETSQNSTTSSNSSPLRRGRSSLSTPSSATTSSVRTKHKILFTGLNDPGLVNVVNNLGGTVTEKPNDCTALVTDKVRRTYKFLCCMAMAVPIVSVEWLKQSEMKDRFLETGDFLLKDPVEEAKFKFDLRRSLARATGCRLLEGYTVVLTPNTAPPPIAEMKGIIQACGGKALVRPPTRWPDKSLIISRQEDGKNVEKYLAKAPKSVRVLSVEFILTGILRHELNFEEHKLEVR